MRATYATDREVGMLRNQADELGRLIRDEEHRLDVEQRVLNGRRKELDRMKRSLALVQARLGVPQQARV